MTKDVTVKFKPDTSEAEEGARKLGNTIAESMTGALAGIVSVTAATAAFKSMVLDAAAAARQHSEAELQLSVALKNRGDTMGFVADRLKQFNEQMSLKKGIDETELVNLQKTLLLHGVNNGALEEATRMTIGLSRVTGQDLQSASIGVARILEGNIGFLKRYGIEATDTASAIAKLDKLSKETTGTQETLTGQIKLLTNQWEMFKRSLFEGGDPKESFAFKSVSLLRTELSGLSSLIEGLGASGTFRVLLSAARGGNAFLGVTSALAMAGAQAQHPDVGQPFSMFPAGPNGPVPLGGGDMISMSPEERSRQDAIAQAGKKERDSRAVEAAKDLAAREKYQSQVDDNMMKEFRRKQELEDKWNIDQLKRQETQAKDELKLAEKLALDKAKLQDDQFELSIATLATQDQERLRLKRAGVNAELVLEQQKHQAIRNMEDQAASTTVAGVAGTMSGIVKAAASGKGDYLRVVGSMVGDTIVRMGDMLVQLGTAGVLAGTLGTVIPAFAALTGGALGVTAGLAAIAGGLAMIGIGTGLGALASPSAPAAAPSSAAAGGANRSQMSSSNFTGPGTMGPQPHQPASQVFIVNFGGGVIASDPRRFARDLSDYLELGGGLRPGAA